MKMKKVLGLLMVFVMMISLLAGCGNSTQKAPETTEPQTQAAQVQETDAQVAETEAKDELSGTITISLAAAAGVQEGWEAVAAGYNEIHPNVDIVIDLKAPDGYADWTTSVLQSENPTVDIGGFQNTAFTDVAYIDFSDYYDVDSPYSDGTWGEQFTDASKVVSKVTGNMDTLALFSVQIMWTYNKDIFEEVGVEPPTTWEEFVTVCEKIAAAGYQPISIAGDYTSFTEGAMAWLAQIYTDQTTRSLLNVYRAQEGDYCYDPDVDGVWTYDPTDPWNDAAHKVNQNIVRVLAAVNDGTYSMNTPGLNTVWTNFAKIFPEYAGGEAMFGTSVDSVSNVFYQGKAAMMINTGGGIIDHMRMMEELEANGYLEDAEGNQVECKTFTLGTFPMPNMSGEGIEANVRTIEDTDGGFQILSKDQAHDDLVMDFIMYYSSTEGMARYLDAFVAAGGILNGPCNVYGVKYPEKIESAFKNVVYMGNAVTGYGSVFSRGCVLVDESYRDFYNNAYEYFLGNITVDEMLTRSQESMDTNLPKLMQILNISETDIENPAAPPAGY